MGWIKWHYFCPVCGAPLDAPGQPCAHGQLKWEITYHTKPTDGAQDALALLPHLKLRPEAPQHWRAPSLN